MKQELPEQIQTELTRLGIDNLDYLGSIDSIYSMGVSEGEVKSFRKNGEWTHSHGGNKKTRACACYHLKNKEMKEVDGDSIAQRAIIKTDSKESECVVIGTYTREVLENTYYFLMVANNVITGKGNKLFCANMRGIELDTIRQYQRVESDLEDFVTEV